MRILSISKFHFDYRGGVEKEAKRLSNQLGTKYKIDTICFGSKDAIDIISENERIFTFSSRRILGKVDLSFSMVNFLNSHATDYDVVWVHYPNILPVIILGARRWRKKPTIIQYQNDIKVLPLMYYLFRPFERMLLNKAEVIITSSPHYHLYSQALKSFSNKVRPIPIRIEGAGEDKLKMNPTKDRDIVLTAVGRYTQYKGYEKLIKLVANVSGLRLNIVCSSKMPDDLINFIESSDNIVVLRNLNDSDLENVLNSTHVFVLSSVSRNEGFGIVLLEALRLGIPICVNKIEGTGSEFITKPGVNGEFFNINEPESFYSAIRQIADESCYKDYCAEALNDFNSRFKSNDSYEFLEVLDSLAKTSH